MKKKRAPWVQRHLNDTYVKAAVQGGYRSRAAFKLLQIQNQDLMIKKSMKVLDLGAAPGSWCQVVKEILGTTGQVIGVDILEMEPVEGVQIIQGDFLEDQVLVHIKELMDVKQELSLEGKAKDSLKVDVILSDMSPNLSGQASLDQARFLRLWEAVLTFAKQVLKEDGSLLMKMFHGNKGELFQKRLIEHFKIVKVRKPPASRFQSKEFYVVAKGFQG